VKYLVNVTPDGFISFVSKGYGGRLSDVSQCQCSGFLQTLAPGRSLMADRGFKHLEPLLDQQNVKLVRPPSIVNKQAMSAQDCDLTRKVAAARIHVERLIERLRKYAFVAPHSTVPISMVPLLDHAVIIAAGLTNLSTMLIKD
jgi:hypothetical protein